ncbi:MAG: glycosyltransferase family 9 protein [Candidatus Omnitrophica bacterium]|nr:glycosyltransferase family 9 protein [Candidatus Omnitrophota bacterium]
MWRKKINPDEIKKILIVSLSNIGDCILTTPVLASLKKGLPHASISIIIGPSASGIFEDDKRVDEVIIYNKRMRFKDKLRFVDDVKKKGFDLVVDLRNSLMPLLLGARYSTGLLGARRRGTHKIREHLSKLDAIGIGADGARDALYVDESSEEYAYDFLKSEKVAPNDTVIGLAAGAKSLIKRWPKESFAKLADMLAETYHAKIILFGSEDETPLNEEITGMMKNGAMLASGKTTIPQLISLMRRLNLLITNDSAALHIASLLGVPQVAIFGPTDPKKYGPLGKGDSVVSKGLGCSPCEVAQCNKNLECMVDISPAEVFEAAAKVLKSRW